MILTPEQIDFAHWAKEIDAAVHEPNAILSNLKITRCHYRLSLALRAVLGDDAGANFHTWAVWGSRKAGVTVRQEDLDDARRDGTVVGGIVGCLVGVGLGWYLMHWLPWMIVPAMAVFGAACGAMTGRQIIVRSRRVSSRLILEGNRTVLEDIGMQTARFIAAFHDHRANDPQRLAAFMEGLRPGDTTSGGQDLLRRAFRHYHAVKYATDAKEKQEAAYLANCEAVLHEHYRLEPYIKGSMPWIVRHCVTKRLLQFDIGPVRLAVSKDVPAIEGIPFPESLREPHNAELIEFLTGPDGWDPPSLAAAGGARDWSKIRERMRYIVRLFRALHQDAVVFRAPYNDEQMAAVAAGMVPPRPL